MQKIQGPVVPDTWSSAWSSLAPAEPAVKTADDVWTRARLMAHAAWVADWLDGLGCSVGALPALVDSEAPSFALFLGALGSGRYLAPLGTRLTASELVATLAGSSSTHLVATPGREELARLVGERSGKSVIVLPELGHAERVLRLDGHPDDIAFLLHTSGTTGQPKPVPWRQGALAARIAVMSELELGPGSVYGSSSPFHHVAGLGNFAYAMSTGAAVASMPPFSVEAWRGVRERGITHALLVPTMIEILLAAGELRRGDVQVIHYGSAPIHPETLETVVRTMPDIGLVQMYGQTEGTPITCLTRQDHRDAVHRKPGLRLSVGRPVRDLEVRIDAPNDGGEGEILARGQHLSTGPDTWLRTGDVGCLDEDGYLYIRGRLNDMILRSGEKVYPIEVEQALAKHPAVREVAVVGVPDRRHGQRVKAFLSVHESHAGSEPEALRRELTVFARSALSGFKVPAEWQFIDVLPRNSAGKLQRHRLLQDDES
jgi:acyl-CoA synthetase (AMP-forming)/AMP-acid ligase II